MPEMMTVELHERSCLNGRYFIKQTLGVGGFGITYEAYDQSTGKRYAIKELYPQGIVNRMQDGVSIATVSNEKLHIFEHSKERFLEEAETLQRLNEIPEVVSVYDFFQENGTCYFVMEYVDGISVKKMIRSSSERIPYEVVREVAAKLGRALGAVHSYRMFHRDIAPDNIMITYDGGVKLVDFGNAKELNRQEMRTMSVTLKPGFAPPEQYSVSAKQGTYTDVYSFACTLYFMLCGRTIPEAMSRVRGEHYVRLYEFGFPGNVSDAFDRALKLKASERTQTVEEFLRDLDIPYDAGSDRSERDSEDDDRQWLTRRVENYADKKMRLNPKQKQAYLEILQFGKAPKRYKLPVNISVTIGKSGEFSDVVVSGDDYVSRRHCEVVYDESNQRFMMMDHSMNGLYINGKKAPKEQWLWLRPGYLVMLGSDKSGFRVGEM